jgi:DNA-binding response OmpR family regulator
VQTVLVVEDERDIREVLRRYLERAGMAVLSASTGAEALRLADAARPDLVLLDLGLPDIDGVDVLAEIAPTTPVVVLTARSALEDRIGGLRHGADDYVVKPFSPTEVVLRVQAVLARTHRRTEPRPVSFADGRLVIDEARHQVLVDTHPVDLTPHEWSLLTSLAASPGRLFSRRELVERLSGLAFDGYERTVDSHVMNLRHKLGDTDRIIVQTVVGFGYRLGMRPDA